MGMKGQWAPRMLWMGVLAALASVWVGSPIRAGEPEKEQAPIVKEIRVSGSTSNTAEQIKYKMGTREGKPLDRKVLDEDFQRLFKMGIYSDVQFKEEPVDGGVRIIVLLVEKPVVKRIVFRGNERFKTHKLQEAIKIKVGDRYDEGQASRDARALMDMYKDEFFHFVEVEAKAEPFQDGVQVLFDIDEAGRLYVKRIVFRGNQAFSARELQKYMETKGSTWFSRGKYDRRAFERDLERLNRFYQSKGYLDVKVKEQPFQIEDKGGKRFATITIDVEEGKQYHVGRVDFKGNNLIPSATLRDIVETMPGEVYSQLVVQKDVKLIRDIYGKYPSSRYFTKVVGKRIFTEEGAVVDVLFEVKEGKPVKVGPIVINGATKTKDHVFRRNMELYPGEKFDSKKLNQSKRNFHNQNYCKTVDVDVKPEGEDMAKVVVDIEEKPTGKLLLGAGVSSKESFLGSIQLKQENFSHKDWPESWKEFLLGKAFVGDGEYFSVNVARGSKSQNYSLDWMNPWMFNRPVRFGFGGFYRTYEWSRYDEGRYGAYMKLGRKVPWLDHLDASMTYRIEKVTLDDFDTFVGPDLLAEEGSNWISRVIFNLTYDTRDSRFDPTEGLYLSASQEFAGTFLGGSKDFWRGFLEGNYYHPVWRDSQKRPWVLALRGELGAAEAMGDDDHVPIYERMYAGGIGSIRGFEYHSVSPKDIFGDEVGGELRNTYSVEFFVPVWEDMIRASAFYDIGAVWAQLDEMDDDPWKSSVGVGLHIRTPLGPLPVRLYYAHALDAADEDDTETFQFTFGAFF